MRRRFKMRRRSRSEQPPHTPWSMRLVRAYSRHDWRTGQSAQMRRATSTPTPSLGKKVDGAISLHRPHAIHSVSIKSLRSRLLYGESARKVATVPIGQVLSEMRQHLTEDRHQETEFPRQSIRIRTRYSALLMSVAPDEPDVNEPPRGHVRVVYLGPVAPHWEVHSDFGDRALIEEF